MSLPPLISAALITKNEERNLASCLTSLQGLVDEVIVVDTGSSDKTVEIAEEYGARIFHHPWRDDFADARNVSLDKANGSWILYIDADERVSGITRAQLELDLANPENVAYRVWLQPRVNSTAYREYRLWRSDPRIRFDGIIHERVVPAIHEVASREGKSIGLSELSLLHVGYEGDQTEKNIRNLPLLRRQIILDPTNLFVRYHLAKVLGDMGEVEESEKILESTVAYVRGLELRDPVASLSFLELIRRYLQRGESADDLIQDAHSRFPGNLGLLWIEARSLIATGRYAEALVVLKKYTDIVGQGLSSPNDPAYDRRLLGELPWDSAGLCHFKIGNFVEAAAAYQEAALRAEDPTPYISKRAIALAKISKDLSNTNDDHPVLPESGRSIFKLKDRGI
ncbi:MAG: glycosyltransferase [Actinomycetota bacterium]|nr:glycosyltransferase [Actinomycetota bacterium]